MHETSKLIPCDCAHLKSLYWEREANRLQVTLGALVKVVYKDMCLGL